MALGTARVLAAMLTVIFLFLALSFPFEAYAVADFAPLGSGGGGVAFAALPTGLRPYMTLQFPEHGHIFRRTTDIVVAATIGNFTMPRDGYLMGFLNGCGAALVFGCCVPPPRVTRSRAQI